MPHFYTFKTLSRDFQYRYIPGGKKKGSTTCGDGPCNGDYALVIGVWAPDISIEDEDMGLIGGSFGIPSSRNIVLHTVIPGNRQSLVAAERRQGHFRTTIGHIVGNRKANCTTRREWKEPPAITMAHLGSQVQQLGGSAPGKRVFGRTPKTPVGAAGGPHFRISRIRRIRPRPKHIAYLGNSPNSTIIAGGRF